MKSNGYVRCLITWFNDIHKIPKKFILHFHRSILDSNIAEINAAYEGGWNKLTEKYFAKTEWPDAELIAPLVNDDQVFLTLYRELYFRCVGRHYAMKRHNS